MIPDKILYTDGRDVTVTDTTFQVKSTLYKLNGITKYGMTILRPERRPGILLFFLGSILAVCGILDLFPTATANIQPDSNALGPNTLALWIGACLAVIGILAAILVKERYAVRISTAEGEKNAIVSPKKEYITQIVDALNEALSIVREKKRIPTYPTYSTVK